METPLDALLSSPLAPTRLGPLAEVLFDRLLSAATSGTRVSYVGDPRRELAQFLARLPADHPSAPSMLARATALPQAAVRAAVVDHPAVSESQRAALVATETRATVLLAALEATTRAGTWAMVATRACELDSAKLVLAALTHPCATGDLRGRLLAALGPTLRGQDNEMGGLDAAVGHVPGLRAVVLRHHGADTRLLVKSRHWLERADLGELAAAAERLRDDPLPADAQPHDRDRGVQRIVRLALDRWARTADLATADAELAHVLDVLAQAPVAAGTRLQVALAAGCEDSFAQLWDLATCDDDTRAAALGQRLGLDDPQLTAAGRPEAFRHTARHWLLHQAPFDKAQVRAVPVAWLGHVDAGPRLVDAVARAAGEDPSTLLHALSRDWHGTLGELLDAAAALA